MPEPGRSGRRHTLVIKRGPQRGRTVHFGGGKRTYGALRKTTRKGAYNKKRKQNFQNRRVPFVETKQQTDSLVALKAGVTTPGAVDDTIRLTTSPLSLSNGVIGNVQEMNLLPLFSFYNMNKGLEASDMIGQSVYSRFLKTKLEFELPKGVNAIRHPCDVYVIHGFITQPLGYTLNTAPTQNGAERSSLINHISEQITQYFNQRLDKLQFIPKRTSNLKILGYRKLRVQNNAQLGVDTLPDNSNYVGAKPLINMVCNFPMKRKIHYVEGTSNNSLQYNYPNYAWLPFICIYNPTAGDFLDTTLYPTEPKIKVRYNTIHYFQDS